MISDSTQQPINVDTTKSQRCWVRLGSKQWLEQIEKSHEYLQSEPNQIKLFTGKVLVSVIKFVVLFWQFFCSSHLLRQSAPSKNIIQDFLCESETFTFYTAVSPWCIIIIQCSCFVGWLDAKIDFIKDLTLTLVLYRIWIGNKMLDCGVICVCGTDVLCVQCRPVTCLPSIRTWHWDYVSIPDLDDILENILLWCLMMRGLSNSWAAAHCCSFSGAGAREGSTDTQRKQIYCSLPPAQLGARAGHFRQPSATNIHTNIVTFWQPS